MKIHCEIIRDLIPLIEDDVCSEQSKEIVLEHIKNCEECRRIYETSKVQPALELSTEETIVKKAIGKGLHKIKRRWIASILVVILLVPICFLTWGQYHGRGISFTNINEILIANSFLKDLKKGDYETAFSHMNIEPLKKEWLDEWFDEEKLKNFDDDAERVFCESASLLTDAGGIQDFEFLAVDRQPDSYTVYYTVVVDGKEHALSMDITNNGIKSFFGAGSFINDPVAHFGAWSEYLWEEYEGCYFDTETKKYVYY